MAEKACIKRLQKEYRALCKEPVSHVVARPSPNDILEWHYVLEGSEGTPFAGGYYYGKIKFPPEYPYKPPGITMTTPNGRFMTQKKICLSMSDFHPESWNPMWSVSRYKSFLTFSIIVFITQCSCLFMKSKVRYTCRLYSKPFIFLECSILTGLLSFMMDTSPTTGSVNTTVAEKQRLAKSSLAFNCKTPAFRKLFPEYVEKYNQEQLAEQAEAQQTAAESPLQESNTRAESEKAVELRKEDSEGGLKERRKNKKQGLPAWIILLLVSVFGVVMALPLLQL
ncbi:ubiquitin-conjugating enzyme E2 34 isoform X1 [Brassica napus]|uniref:ubiquitin-conjugating enzyme E2 34 isoform X1 n=1 Tax=Brassica napus TaxID=3708 RepID=UPI00207985BC|nr:ubiquitin-conjugating enzyme E2 34 isoform X1 [Brassica napus]XP_048621146.1 ubiquitin-conjugating enzyme E2 34 isoform X1 [Brassica napus]